MWQALPVGALEKMHQMKNDLAGLDLGGMLRPAVSRCRLTLSNPRRKRQDLSA